MAGAGCERKLKKLMRLGFASVSARAQAAKKSDYAQWASRVAYSLEEAT